MKLELGDCFRIRDASEWFSRPGKTGQALSEACWRTLCVFGRLSYILHFCRINWSMNSFCSDSTLDKASYSIRYLKHTYRKRSVTTLKQEEFVMTNFFKNSHLCINKDCFHLTDYNEDAYTIKTMTVVMNYQFSMICSSKLTLHTKSRSLQQTTAHHCTELCMTVHVCGYMTHIKIQLVDAIKVPFKWISTVSTSTLLWNSTILTIYP